MTPIVLNLAIAALYLCSAALLARELGRARRYARAGTWLRLAPGLLGALLHLWALAPVLLSGGANARLGFFAALSLAALAIVLLLLLLTLVRPVESLGVGLLPVAALSVLAGVLVDDPTAGGAPIAPGLLFHIVVSILAYGVLSVGAMQAVLVGVQAHLLHSHQPAGFVRALPPLNTMESLLFQLLGAGFALLSVALLSGFHFLDDMFAQHLVHKTTLSLAAWAVFGMLLVGRYAWGWRGLRAVRWTLVGLGFLVLAYFGSKLVLELVLGRA